MSSTVTALDAWFRQHIIAFQTAVVERMDLMLSMYDDDEIDHGHQVQRDTSTDADGTIDSGR